jgi:aminoglycoside phosphotransferase (APT) family kinase protein
MADQPSSLAWDAEAVAAFVGSHTPLAVDAVDLLGAGTESVAWRIDRDWAARFPLTPAASRSLEREVALAPLLGAALTTPVPRFEYVIRTPGGRPIMSLYRFLVGVPLSVDALASLSEKARTRALDDVAAVLDALRMISIDAAAAAGASEHPDHGFGHPGQRELHHRHATLLGAANVQRVEALWIEYERSGIGGRDSRRVLTHADLKPEHVLHDPATGRLTGVLDWGDACLSHPDFDPAIIGLFFSPDIRDQVVARLTTAGPAPVTSTARLFVAVRWLTDLDVEVVTGDESFQAFCVAGLAAHLDDR